MASAEQFTLRRPVDGDVEALYELYLACDLVDEGREDSDHEDVLWRWRTPEFDRSADAWIAEDGGRAVAYGWVFEGLADVKVHPAARGKGLGQRLLELTERRAVVQGSRDGNVRQNATSLNPTAHSLLVANGYEKAHHYTRFEIDLAERPAVPAFPPGVVVRPYEVGPDDAAVHEAFNRAWSQYEGDRWAPETLERWLENIAGEDFDPTTWHLAVEEGRVVAFCLCEQYPDLGWVQYLGTVPEERGRGLGRALLLHAFATYFDRGYTKVGLTASSENVAAAHQLYLSAGMRSVLRYDNYKKPLDAIRADPSE